MGNTTVHSAAARVSGHRAMERQRRLVPYSPLLYHIQSDEIVAPGNGQEGLSTSWEEMGVRCAWKKSVCVTMTTCRALLAVSWPRARCPAMGHLSCHGCSITRKSKGDTVWQHGGTPSCARNFLIIKNHSSEQMAPSMKDLYRSEDLSWTFGPRFKGWVWQHLPIISACTWEAEAGGSLALHSQPA